MKRFAAILLLVLLTSVDGFAKVGNVSDAPAVRHPHELRKGRHEISVFEGVTLADSYTINLLTQLSYKYHVLDWLGVGLEAAYGASFATPLTNETEGAVNSGEWSQQNPGQKYNMSRSGLAALVLLDIEFVPFSGKMVLFRKFLGYVDFHIVLGGGYALVRGVNNLSNESTGVFMVGGGFRFYPTKYLSINLEVKDYMVYRTMNRKLVLNPASNQYVEQNTSKKFSQNPTFLIGLSVFFPMAPTQGF